MPRSLDEARAMARERFKTRLSNGEKVGECACHDDQAAPSAGAIAAAGPGAAVVGVRFRDSGQTFYFDARGLVIDLGDWVVVGTARGQEAVRVVIAPHQVALSQLDGELGPVERVLDAAEVERMAELRQESAGAVRRFGAELRQRRLPMKPISADYSFDGSVLTLSYSAPARPEIRGLAQDLSRVFGTMVDLQMVGPRDEARLLGGLGRCGRTLCCSSWLPVYPEISMGMAKTQDLALNPTKVSGVCGRLLCCLSYENEQYKQMKAVLPRLGQRIETPAGTAMVVSLQVVREIVTVRVLDSGQEITFSGADLGVDSPAYIPASILAGGAPTQTASPRPVPDTRPAPVAAPAGEPGLAPRRKRRKRRRGGGGARTGGEG